MKKIKRLAGKAQEKLEETKKKIEEVSKEVRETVGEIGREEEEIEENISNGEEKTSSPDNSSIKDVFPKEMDYSAEYREKPKDTEEFLSEEEQSKKGTVSDHDNTDDEQVEGSESEESSESSEAEKKYINAEEWLNNNYPKEKRAEIKELEIDLEDNECLEGELDLSDFVNLTELDCSNNKLTALNISSCSQLEYIDCSDNQLTNLDVSNCPKIYYLDGGENYLDNLGFLNDLNEKELEQLYINDNNFPKSGLDIFSKFTNLKYLNLSNNEERENDQETISNRFCGSLKPLRNLIKLEGLDIEGTDVSSGLEYLPASIKKVCCDPTNNPNALCKNIQEKLEIYEKKDDSYEDYYDYQDWRNDKDNRYLIREINKKETKRFKLEIEQNEELLEDSSLQEEWEERGFTKNEINKWIKAGFSPHEVDEVKEWEEFGFKVGEAKLWREAGLESSDYEFAHYLERKGYDPRKKKNLNYQKLGEKYEKSRKSKSFQIMKTAANIPPKLFNKVNEIILSDDLSSIKLDGLKGKGEKQNDIIVVPSKSQAQSLIKLCQAIIIGQEQIKRNYDEDDIKETIEIIENYQRANDDSEEKLVWNTYEKKTDKLAEKVINKLKSKLNRDSKPEKDKFEKKYYEFLEIGNYDRIYPAGKELSWKINEYTPSELPTRLCNVRKLKREEFSTLRNNDVRKCVKEKEDIKSVADNYATLSYVWGEKEKKEFLSADGRKSLVKAIKVCQLPEIDVDYLWMDQLCINQDNPQEKAREVSKMRQYYSNAAVTLVAMHLKIEEGELNELRNFSLNQEEDIKKIVKGSLPIIEKIILSDWFDRSWTFQEGWLSKQTIFMFDNVLIDGRILASVWKLKQSELPWEIEPDNQPRKKRDSFLEISKTDPEEFWERKVGKVATPIGWTYYKGGYSPRDVVQLGLNEALKEMKNRKRALAIDGIYSVLGLLPYGSQVKIDYSGDENHQYTKDEIRKALTDVMRTALKAGYAEPLAWHGPGSRIPGLCWTPRVDMNGSTSVESYLEVKCIPERVDFNIDGIEVIGSEYTISSIQGKPEPFSGEGKEKNKKVDDSGFYQLKVKVNVSEEEEANSEEIKLMGTKETLEAVTENNVLIVFSKGEWKSDKPFAILATKEANNNIRHRVGLVELLERTENELRGAKRKKLIIGNALKTESLFQEIIQDSRQNCQVEIPPK